MGEEANTDTINELTVAASSSSVISDGSFDSPLTKQIASDRSLYLQSKRTTGPTRRSKKGGWTTSEDDLLKEAVKIYEGRNWKKIAEYFEHRTDVQCLHRWQKVLNPNLIKGPWTKEEDDRITELVEKNGCKKWSIIAQSLPGRIGKQCRERWHNHLNPAIKREPWTREEELTLIRAHQIYGNKWAEIAKFLPGRTDNSIKNHWNCSVEKKLDSYLPDEFSGELPGFSGELPRGKDLTNAEVAKGSQGRTVDSSCGVDTCSRSSALGYAKGRKKHIPLGPVHITNSRALQEVDFVRKPTTGIQCDSAHVTASGTVSENHRGHASHVDMPYGLNHPTSQFEVQRETSLGDSTRFKLSKKWLKKSVDPLERPSFPPSGDRTPRASTSNVLSDGTFSSRASDVHPEIDPSVTAMRLLESPKRLRHDAYLFTGGNMDSRSKLNVLSHGTFSSRASDVHPEIDPSVTAMRLLESPKRPCHDAYPFTGGNMGSRSKLECNSRLSTASTSKFESDTVQFCRQSIVHSKPLHPNGISLGGLCYEPPQLMNMDIVGENNRYLSTEDYTWLAGSPVCYSTPPNHVRKFSVDTGSPESVLRSAAKSFKSTPSIIRKRGREMCRLDLNTSDSDGICTPEIRTQSSDDMKAVQSSTLAHRDQYDLNNADVINAKWLSLSSSYSLKREATAAAVKSVRLEYAFDRECDHTGDKYTTSAAVSDSPGASLDANTRLMSFDNSNDFSRVGFNGFSRNFRLLDSGPDLTL